VPLSAHPLFTIGHSNHPLERFVELLRRHGIGIVADVRSAPVSARHPQYNREALKSALAERRIGYLFLGRELGARRAEPGAYEGNLAVYERIARLPAFREGLERVKEAAADHRVALMCAEKDPLDCHRALLVGRHLRGAIAGGIHHILADGTIEPHAQAEERLIAAMGMNADQPDMFAGDTEPLLERAYRQRGLKIAYRTETKGGG
jgi:uncharacterized protein (DUF488 family)